jgi:peptidoglycan/xylan/chitin deacetylase (PgdA/CDA1 family)
MWDVLTHDYSKTISPEQCLKGSAKATRPGSIIVFHDSLKAERNMTYVLPKFLEHFTSQGFKFKTLLDI